MKQARHPFDLAAAGYSVASRPGRVYLLDQAPAADAGMRPAEARQLARALDAAATAAEQSLVVGAEH